MLFWFLSDNLGYKQIFLLCYILLNHSLQIDGAVFLNVSSKNLATEEGKVRGIV